jgi:hypothetical protein
MSASSSTSSSSSNLRQLVLDHLGAELGCTSQVGWPASQEGLVRNERCGFSSPRGGPGCVPVLCLCCALLLCYAVPCRPLQCR